MDSPHALLLPYPAQGHVIPLMELAYCLINCGFKITFVNTEFNHNRITAALSKTSINMHQLRLATIPDGMDPQEDRNDLGKLTEGILNVMPGCLEELILEINKTEEKKISCLIADESMAWSLEVAQKMGLKSAVFWPACAGILATMLSIPKLIEDGIIEENGTVKKQDMICLGPGMPAMNTAHLIWNCIGDSKTREIVYNCIIKNNQACDIADFMICNSFYEIEQPVFAYLPKLLPVGPLLTGHRSEKPIGHFWSEDKTCMTWLDEQTAKSVIYVAFGSFTVLDQCQFQELALGLELTGRPFLWVVRPDLTDGSSESYPHGFLERVGTRGRIVGWSPQQRVLAHPSIACFLTHCGWNSTMEGVRNGLPFLCWPYFADQFLNESYICDVWQTGFRMSRDESGIIRGKEIELKTEELLRNEEFRARAMILKENARISVNKGGSSYENLKTFTESMKD